MEQKVPAERDKNQKDVFIPAFLSLEKKRDDFQNNIDEQKKKTLVLPVATHKLRVSCPRLKITLLVLNIFWSRNKCFQIYWSCFGGTPV